MTLPEYRFCWRAFWQYGRSPEDHKTTRLQDYKTTKSRCLVVRGLVVPPGGLVVRRPVVLLAWLLAVELGTEWWYRSHERNQPKPAAWAVELPRDKADFREMPLSEKTRQFLRYDEGINARWLEQGRGWQAIFLRWNPGRIAARMALGHTPETCLTAAGRQLLCAWEPRSVNINGVSFPVRFYTFAGEGGPVHVLYCLRQERAAGFNAESLTWRTRLAAVMTGARNTGQRSLELALWGEANEQEAYSALERQFVQIVRKLRETTTDEHSAAEPQPNSL